MSANNMSIDKRSLILKSTEKPKKPHNMSYDQIEATFNGKFVSRKRNPTIKPKIRYKTHQNEVD